MTFDYRFVDKESIETILPELFKILHANMSVIAPTGETFEEDFAVWKGYIVQAVKDDSRQIVTMHCNGELAGYFQYDTGGSTFMMEEIQVKPHYQGSGIFRGLYRWLEDKIPEHVIYAEAYSNKENLKSQGILEHMGLERAGENKSGSSYLYRGNCRELWNSFR